MHWSAGRICLSWTTAYNTMQVPCQPAYTGNPLNYERVRANFRHPRIDVSRTSISDHYHSCAGQPGRSQKLSQRIHLLVPSGHVCDQLGPVLRCTANHIYIDYGHDQQQAAVEKSGNLFNRLSAGVVEMYQGALKRLSFSANIVRDFLWAAGLRATVSTI